MRLLGFRVATGALCGALALSGCGDDGSGGNGGGATGGQNTGGNPTNSGAGGTGGDGTGATGGDGTGGTGGAGTGGEATGGAGGADPTGGGGPGPACGWDEANEFYACGFVGEDPQGFYPIDCPPDLVEGDPCGKVPGAGCCAPDGTNWYCGTSGGEPGGPEFLVAEYCGR
ncbi:MAG: hypothetical protein HOW73_51155 [Polyangiaceae bacterium]|nr:hypothetical protein [Polyangiaceae bacterium]